MTPPRPRPPCRGPSAEAEGQRAQKARDRHARVHAAAARGLTITQISRDLQLDRKTVRRYAAAADPAGLLPDTPAPARPPAPGSKKVAAWILTPPGKLTDEHRAGLDAIIARCPELGATRTLVRQFADMLLADLHHHAKWARASDWPHLLLSSGPPPQRSWLPAECW